MENSDFSRGPEHSNPKQQKSEGSKVEERGGPGDQGAPDFEGDSTDHEKLSRREDEVMRLLASGKTVKETASILALGVKTISTYRRRLLEKLGLKSVAQLREREGNRHRRRSRTGMGNDDSETH